MYITQIPLSLNLKCGIQENSLHHVNIANHKTHPKNYKVNLHMYT